MNVISAIRVHPVLISDPPLLNVVGVHQPAVPRAIIEVITDHGVIGLGETYGDDPTLHALDAVARSLVGTGIFDLNQLEIRVAAALETHSPLTASAPDDRNLGAIPALRRMTRIATAAFDVALLDAQGKTLGLPVHALLGGKVRDRVEFSGYLFYRWSEYPGDPIEGDDWGEALDADGIVSQARAMVARFGFSSLKLKAGVLPPEREIATLQALREAFPHHPLRIDPNTGWSVETTMRMLPALEGLLEYLEDPTPGIQGMAELAAHTRLPLATNMCVTEFEHLPLAIERGAVDVVLTDHHYWGGMRATQKLAGICETWGIDLSMHSNSHLGISLAAMVHLGAVLPALRYACDTHWPWQREDVVEGAPFRFENGSLGVPDAPGLGITLDRGALADLHERWRRSDVRQRDDVAAMRVVDPDWNPVLPRF